MPRLYYLVVKASGATPFVPPPGGEAWHVTHAALAESSSVNSYATLSFKTSDDAWISLGTLHSSGKDFMSLDLALEEYTEFKVTGNVAVHLTGTLVQVEEGLDFDEDDVDDEVMQAVMNGGGKEKLQALMQAAEDSDEESSEDEPQLQIMEEIEPPKLKETKKPKATEAVKELEKGEEIPAPLSKSAKRRRKQKNKEAKAAEKLEPEPKQQKIDKSSPEEAPAPKINGTPVAETKKKRIRRFSNGFAIETLLYGPEEGAEVESGKKVTIKYKGQLEDGTVFDETRGPAGFSFRYGDRQVVKGLDKGLDGMHVGDKRRLTVPAKMGYGAEGAEPSVPPNANLSFDVELLKIE